MKLQPTITEPVQPDVETQIAFEQLYDKNQLIKRVRSEFEIPQVLKHFLKNNIQKEFGLNLMVQMVLHKRAPLVVLVGLLQRHFKNTKDPCQSCVYALINAAEADLLDYSADKDTFIIKHDVDDECYADINRYQYPLPMLIVPEPISNNKQSGYVTINSSIILQDNHHEDDVCLDHINRVNTTKLSINVDTVNMIANSWESLDKRKVEESVADYQKRIKAFDKYDKNSRDIIDHLVQQGNAFYLTHKYDKRGRCYCQGYHVTYQGNEWNKAAIEFAHKELTI